MFQKTVYKVYQNPVVKQKIENTFIIINNDKNVSDFALEEEGNEIIKIDKKDIPELIEFNKVIEEEKNPETDEIKDEAILIVKTIHFEGHAKWAFIFRGYPIKASIKDEEFVERLKNESFRKGDSLQVILSRKRNFDESLQTYIVDQHSYVIEKVIEHTSRNNVQNKLDLR